ncbi:Broad-complex core protein isoform 6, partial [Caligus rogercresseyi]
MGSMERLHLRWNDFESNIKLGFSELREDEDFYDVTLACESKQIKAHKVILSACSPFFRYLIKSVSHAHPLLYLRGIKFDHLEALLSFMYNGEVSVSQEELSSFLSLGEELQIKGLNKGGLSKPPPPEPHFVASESDEQTPEDNGTSPVMVDPIVVDGEFGMNDDLSEGDKELQDYSEVVNEDSGEVSVTHDEL